jgi:transposase-like protein
MEDHAECMLVLIGATPEGRKELVGFQVSYDGIWVTTVV